MWFQRRNAPKGDPVDVEKLEEEIKAYRAFAEKLKLMHWSRMRVAIEAGILLERFRSTPLKSVE